MTGNKSEQVDAYIAGLEPGRQAAVRELREMIFELLPGIKESIKYRMPSYELDEVVVCVASQKHHLSLYMDTELVTKYKDAFGQLNCRKSCIRFKRLEDLPMETVIKIIRETASRQQGVI